MIKAVRGTRDLLPPETALWNFVEAAVRDVFRAYNFQEIRTPIFESTELFARGVGEETDIVSKEMYTWEDRGRRRVDKGQSLTLRPENTAGVVRAYIEHKLWDRGLNKLFYIGPQFRRERPQKGRYRQFYQIGAEVIGPTTAGSESPARDAEVLEMLATLLDRLGHPGLDAGAEFRRLRQRSRGLQRSAAQRAGAGRRRMCVDCQRRAVTNPLRVLDCKVPEDQPIIETLPRIADYLDEGCRKHFEEVHAILTPAAFLSRSTTASCAASTTTPAPRSSSPTARSARRMRSSAAAATTVFPKPSADPRPQASASPSAKTAWCCRCRNGGTDVQRKPDVYIAPMGAA